ncbi:HTTM domain-containing protein [Kineococcus sp. SYSU DK002]|uniref:HTTM domain-containing protein n=1 Tax=Kineococcus sp. SYSU DK002 TaxID=3383123 RepID=UPI003D7DB541
MNSPWRVFDRWVASGPFTALDLGRYRVLYAVVLLLAPSRFAWAAEFPDSFFDAPPGPFALLDAVPPKGVLIGLDVLVVLGAAFLLVGRFTRTASVVVGLSALTGYGISYSFGKIDHNILSVLVPLVLVFARWGDAVSIDALHRRPATGAAAPAQDPPQWPLRLLALLIGLGFLTAAAPKLLGGWLSPATQAVQTSLYTQYFVEGRTELLAGTFLDVRSTPFWESMDVVAVLLEGLLVLAVLHWKAWRVAIALLTLFHLGVLLMMNIGFGGNVTTYAAFVAWGALRVPGALTRPPRWFARHGWVLAAVVGLVVVLLPDRFAVPRLGWAIVVVGALVSTWYLARQVGALLRRVRPGGQRSTPDPGAAVDR